MPDTFEEINNLIFPSFPVAADMDHPFRGYWRPKLSPYSAKASYVDSDTAARYLSLGNALREEGWPVYVTDPAPLPDLDAAAVYYSAIGSTYGIFGTPFVYPVRGLDAWASPINASARFDLSLYPVNLVYPYFRNFSTPLLYDFPHPIDFNNIWESLYARTVARIERCVQARKLARAPQAHIHHH